MPTEVIDYLAEQLGIADASCLKLYAQREPTHWEHAGQIHTKLGTALAAAAANPVLLRGSRRLLGRTKVRAARQLRKLSAISQIRGRACRSWCCCTRSCPGGSAWP
ncbi:DUF4158 domain-containing protein [Nonomuraea jabiensis]|uniref:DUF4158 domain-containing protein n=1 Tax=Nonomuraea jabiensis TaxID=882448 RepID=UPI003D758271